MESSEVRAITRGDVDHALDADSLDSFVRDHHERLVRLARLVCRDASEAGDAVQAAFEQAWRRRSSLRDPSALRSWMDRIVVREAIRMDRRRRRPLFRLFMAPNVQELVDGRAEPSASAADLRVSFEALPAEQRAVLVLHLYYGYSVAETAAFVEAPIETVRSRLRLGRERLRTSLGDER
jgi:RNA polymerase sigma-70 factor (ECF subfamily)